MRNALLSRAQLLKAAFGSLLATAGLLSGRDPARAERQPGRVAPADTTIVRCVIHPGIGIARVGNSPHEYFVGPEVPGVPPVAAGGMKDAAGRIKRQAARFRIYGLNAAGQVVRELTADDADIVWAVHLANKKAAWYQFKVALDIPEVLAGPLPPALRADRRNAGVTDGNRAALVIDPGARSIHGKRVRGRQYHFDTGTFQGRKVPLGELRTDGKGRLLVLGGFGNSGTPQSGNAPVHIANNDGWYDDTSDGPVTATVHIGRRKIPVTAAWVIVAPPNFAPEMTSVVTLYDIAFQAHLDARSRPPRPVSFTHDIYPILARFDRLQWVNEGFYQGYGWGGEVPLLDPALLAQLASNDQSNAQARQQVFTRFRDPSYPALQEDAWPRIYGDNFAQPPESPRQYLAVTREQYRCLSQWAAGNFAADWNGTAAAPSTLQEVPLSQQPAALDRAALESCAGGAFHPGEEAPWVLRHPTVYTGMCRIRPREANDPPEPDYGDTLTPRRALGPDGPLYRSGPGDITRWMALPWQTDTANCGSAYANSTVNPSPLPDLPTFWPAVVPNKILTQQVYQRIVDAGLPLADRQKAFAQRQSWSRHLSSDYLTRNQQIITAWSQLGFVTAVPGPGDPNFPTAFYVETESGFPDMGVREFRGLNLPRARQDLM